MLSEKSSKKINILSFILFIGVMSIHTYNLGVYEINVDEGIILAALETFLYRFANGTCVSFFFLISGFLFFRNFDLSILLQKYKKRWKSIVVPYAAWNTLYYLYYVCVTRIPLIAGMMSGSEKMPIGIMPYFQYIWSGYYTLWFLRELILQILLAPLWYLLLKRRKYYWPEVVLVLLILAGVNVIQVPVMIVNAYYILGSYIGMNYKELKDGWENRCVFKLKDKWGKVTAAASVAVFGGLIIWGKQYVGQFWYNGLLFWAVWQVMNLFSLKKDVPWWMKCTFFYYCAHDMILEAVEKLILILGGKSLLMAWVDYILAPVITLFILIITAWILQKWMPFVWKILSGGRMAMRFDDIRGE